ncbi:Sec-independent protein translocase subunit TatA/TatB [Planctellipticum variicoloris]|jgi:sec-independent protein translocase protein TatA|uniref:Sec-independent protein translocase subunit TatA/TatB n=1 Tax=Planctellipticum variicoloris TaxID=3064265 RepID=UPI003013FF45|nr:twin-arginine translocase TatA/TatE family subunit [Planctomycetaceae bacterium SH412]
MSALFSPFNPVLAFGMPGPFEMIIVGLVILLLFGSRLPSVMKSLGSSISEFKKGTREAELEDHSEPKDETSKKS